MAQTVKLATPALVFPGDGSLRVKFDDGAELEFADAVSLRDSVLAALPNTDGLRNLLIANRIAADPLLDSPAVWDGKQLTFDPEQALPSNVLKVA